MEDLTNAFGERLKKIRTDLNLTQDELAFECDMAASHIGQLERGVKSPTLDTLNKIAFGLSISLPELVDFDIATNPIPVETKTKIMAHLNLLSETDQKRILGIIKVMAK